MERVLVTGATSMMGVALVRECIANKTRVTAVIRPRSKNRGRLPQSEYVTVLECDSVDIGSLPARIAERGFDCFYHFAWDGTAREERNDVFLHERNIHDALAAAKAAHELGCAAFVGAGSQAEYGRVDDIISPDTPARPEYAYGIAKLAAGQLCGQYCAQTGMRFAWGRIFSVYGEYDHGDTMIAYLIRSLLQGETPALTKCEQMWDYLYCADAAHAFYLLGGKGQGVYCVGSGEMRPLAEYVAIIGEKAGNGCKPEMGKKPYAEGQVMRLCADTAKLRQDTGFAVRTPFETGIENTIAWVKKDLGL